MKRFKLALTLALAFCSPTALACGPYGGGFLPENDLKIPVGHRLLSMAPVTEQAFNAILDKVNQVYGPIIASRGGNLVIDRRWNDSTVNAYASRQGSSWIIQMYGGLARHPAITPDGFALVACHELGHHLGGVPKYPAQWAANEGQADYFATLKCLRRVWENEDNVSIVKELDVPAAVVASCEKSFSDANTIAICERVAMAGLSSGRLSQALDGSAAPNFDRPDPSVVQQTFDSHPKAQCRLDTYYGGSICQVKYQEDIGQDDPSVGTCSMEKGDKFGYRPQCWYKPGSGGGGGGGGGEGVAPQPTIGGMTDVIIRNPNQQLAIQYDVTAFANATGAYMEIIGPNRDFAQPNGVSPDPARILFGAQPGTRGSFFTNRPLGWGLFRVRVIPLGGNGTYAVGKFSSGSIIRVQP